MNEKNNLVTFRGKAVTLLGPELKVGDKAPDFTVHANDLSTRSLSDYHGRPLIISVAPSLDTGICDIQTRRFNKEAVGLPGGGKLITITVDLPFAQKRWVEVAEAFELETLSDYYDHSFGLAYGVFIKELHLLARSVFTIDKDGVICYIEIVKETATEPNYEKPIMALKNSL